MTDQDAKVQVIRGGETSDATGQTLGMLRKVAVDDTTVGAGSIWMGHGMAEPQTKSAKHHHAEAETASYMLTGRMRVYFGEGYEEFIEAGPGDFVYVPGHILHYEEIVGDEVATAIIARSPANIVVNLEDTE